MSIHAGSMLHCLYDGTFAVGHYLALTAAVHSVNAGLRSTLTVALHAQYICVFISSMLFGSCKAGDAKLYICHML